jgi:hypothetical protein
MEEAKKKTDAETLFLKGPVKQVMETAYKAHHVAGITVQGKIEPSYSFYRFNAVTFFNEIGFKTSEWLYGNDERVENLFNEKNQWYKSIHYDILGNRKNTTVFTYDEKGNRITDVVTMPDGNLYCDAEYKWAEDGKVTEHRSWTYRNNEKKQSSHVVHEYNEQRQETRITQYAEDGSVKHLTTYTYNEKGQKIEYRSESNENPRIGQRHTYAYNEKGDMTISHVYDHEGNLKATHDYTPKYDIEGKRIDQRKPYNPHELKDGETETNELDAYGNWIKKTIFHNGHAMNIYLRQIAYYGDESEKLPAFVHPLTYTTDVHKEEDVPYHEKRTLPEDQELNAEQLQWVAEMPNATADNFSAYRYYIMQHKEVPSLITYTGPHIEAIALRDQLMKYMEAVEIHSYRTIWSGWENIQRYTLAFPGKPYLLQATGISSQDDEQYDLPGFMENDDGKVHISQINLLRPGEGSGKTDKNFVQELEDYIEECSLTKKPDKPRIHMIEVRNNNFSMVERPVDDNFQINDLDVNYGTGFQKFHNELMQRFQTQTKGLVLFHGQPGTGKTYYIRHLLRKMAGDRRKVVIYMPPNMVDHLVEPGFMTFLASEIEDWSNDGLFSVLLIEDAEPLLAKRQEGVRIQGVTNLLNMSDGLLNDMLNLQIICTFNVDLKKLDSALLRPGRLLARKEFKPLGVLDANLLAQRLGIKHHFTQPASLAEIYTMGKNKNTLIHDVEPDQDSSTLIDDILN